MEIETINGFGDRVSNLGVSRFLKQDAEPNPVLEARFFPICEVICPCADIGDCIGQPGLGFRNELAARAFTLRCFG
jgi:hypothetical protein